mmetsp:Transcript_56500/g.138669  ORF Transcript_56500/g.138669 Transcript_56500/m.138669 type:complete len:483 (-) Transcript_56500:56-1504(-)
MSDTRHSAGLSKHTRKNTRVRPQHKTCAKAQTPPPRTSESYQRCDSSSVPWPPGRHKAKACTRHDTNGSVRSELGVELSAHGLHQALSHEHGVEGRAAQELVAAHEELEAVVAEDDVLPDPADLDGVALGGREGHGVQLVGRVIDNLDARRLGEEGRGGSGRDGLLRLDDHRLSVRAEGRDAHRRARHRKIGDPHDLLALPRDLHFLLGVTVGLEHVDVGDDVEGKGVGEELVGRDSPLGAVDNLGDPVPQLSHALGASAGSGLVRRHEHLLEAELLVKGPEGHDADGRRAVGVGNELLRALARVVGVDLGHAQRDVLLVAEGRRVVDHHRAVVTLSHLLAPLLGEVAADRHEDDVKLAGAGQREILDFNSPPLGLHLPAGGALRAEQAELPHVEAALLEDPDDLLADGTRRAADADLEGLVGGKGDGHAEAGGGVPRLGTQRGAREGGGRGAQRRPEGRRRGRAGSQADSGGSEPVRHRQA